MKVKRFFSNILVLLIFSAAVFFIGWIQFSVKPGSCAIMTSKTGGLYEKPVVSGVFTWRWERLLPTNVSLAFFDLSARTYVQTVSGELPSAQLYSSRLPEKNADFSYSVQVSVSLCASPEKIHSLAAENKIASDSDLASFYEAKSKVAATRIAEFLISRPQPSYVSPAALTQQELAEIAAGSPGEFSGITLSSVQILDAKIPDIRLYSQCRENYSAYLSLLRAKMEQKAEHQAEMIAEQDRVMAQLEKLGSMMQKYPQIEELLKTGDAAQIMNALRRAPLPQ